MPSIAQRGGESERLSRAQAEALRQRRSEAQSPPRDPQRPSGRTIAQSPPDQPRDPQRPTTPRANPLHIISPRDYRSELEAVLDRIRREKIAATEAIGARENVEIAGAKRAWRKTISEATPDQREDLAHQADLAVNDIRERMGTLRRETILHYDQMSRGQRTWYGEQIKSLTSQQQEVLKRIKAHHRETVGLTEEQQRRKREIAEDKQERNTKIFLRDQHREESYARIAGRLFRTYLVREFGGHRAGRINAAGEAAQEASMRIGDTPLGRTLALAGTVGKAVGTMAAMTKVAYEISQLPERLANLTRNMSTASGGPSLERIQAMSPAAAVAQARQNATAAMGALESSRIIGEASRRRIEADTKLAEASRKASDNLFVRATPIYELYQGAKTGIVSVFAGQAGVENGFRDRVVGENAVVASLRRQIEETIQKAFFPGQQKERSDALESWAKGLAADAAKKGSLRSLFMFQEKWLKPLEYPEFENGLPQAGTMERVPPVWVEEGLEFN